MELYEDFSESEIIGEGPCEFCGELYPLIILIEHETACRPDLAHFNYGDDFGTVIEPATITNTASTNLDDAVARQFEAVNIKCENTIRKEPLVAAIKEDKTLSNVIPVMKNAPKEKIETLHTQKIDINTDIKQAFEKFQKANSDKVITDKVQAKKNQTRQTVAFEESGDKLFGTGNDLDDFENEKQACKIPNNPLLECVNIKDDIEDVNNLTDDDCDESLEEFWKRARDCLKRRKMKNI